MTNNMVVITVTDEDGTVLDSIEVERGEFLQAQIKCSLAASILSDLNIGYTK